MCVCTEIYLTNALPVVVDSVYFDVVAHNIY